MTDDSELIETIRLRNFTGDLVTQRLGNNRAADEALFRKHYGAGGSNDFWARYFFDIKSLTAFIRMLTLTRASRWDEIQPIKAALRKAMVQAYQSDQTFFRGAVTAMAGVNYYHELEKPEMITVLVRPAAEWLHSSPTWQHLVPDTLKAFLNPKTPAPVAPSGGQVAIASKRGPKGGLTEKAADAMLADLKSGKRTISTLREMKKETLAGDYNVRSRDTAGKALVMALSTFAGIRNSGK